MKRPSKILPFSVVAAAYRKGEMATIYPAWKRWGAKAVTFVFLSCLLSSAAHAQESSGVRSAQANLTASDGSAKPKANARVDGECGGKFPCPISEKVKSLRLGWAGRFARGFQYDYELNEQSGTVLVDFERESETVTRPIRNPQSYLQKHTFTFKFGELFPERLSMFKRGSDYLKKNPEAADKELSVLLCEDKPLITCLTKGGSWWKRALMGTSVNGTLAQRPVVVQQIIVTDPKFGKDFLAHVGFVFDPAKLFPTATSWKSTFDDVKGIDNALALLGAADARSGRRPWEKNLWAAALIPKVEFKVLSQFDFIKYGGELREARFPNRALNTWKFTWDLTRAIPDTKSRLDADAIDQAMDGLRAGLGRKEEPTWQKQCVLNPAEKDRFVDVLSAFPAESCQKLAKVLEAKKYAISCVLRKGASGEILQRYDGTETDSTKTAPPPTPNECKW